MGWALFLMSLAIGAALLQWRYIEGEKQKTEATADAAQVRSDLDTLLGAEQGKLTTEFETQTKRLTEYKETVLGSQRQGLAVRGDFGGEDTAAAKILAATENKAAEDQSALGGSYQAGLDVLAKQTDLAKSQLDMNLGMYLNAITASQIDAITGFISGALIGLGNMQLPSVSPTLLDTPTPGSNYSYIQGGWDAARGIPRFY